MAIDIINYVTFSQKLFTHYELVPQSNFDLKTILHQSVSEQEFLGGIVHKFRKIAGRTDFSDQFTKIIKRFKRFAYNLNVLQLSTCSKLSL